MQPDVKTLSEYRFNRAKEDLKAAISKLPGRIRRTKSKVRRNS